LTSGNLSVDCDSLILYFQNSKFAAFQRCFLVFTLKKITIMFEYEVSKKADLIKELKKGEKSGFIKDFDRDSFLRELHKKHPFDEIKR
jgi:hypothetical protein